MQTNSSLLPDKHGPRLYGRSSGHALSARQARLVAELLPRLGLPEKISARSDLAPEGVPLWLEIGFGAAEHLLQQAKANPGVRLIGVEPYLNGVAKALSGIDAQKLDTIRIVRGDARELVARLPDASLDRVFILHPDPWPKKRHWKRRIIQRDFVADLARVLKPGGRLRFASDIAHYQAWALQHILDDSRFEWTAERADDWRMPPSDHFTTRYEQKARKAGRACAWLDFVRAH